MQQLGAFTVRRPSIKAAKLNNSLPNRPVRTIPPEPVMMSGIRRTPTGLSTKQLKRAHEHAVDVEGGLDICVNVEVNPQDPAGITTPYRLLVPRLWYEYEVEDEQLLMSGAKTGREVRGEESDDESGTEKEEEAVEQQQKPAPTDVRRLFGVRKISRMLLLLDLVGSSRRFHWLDK